MTTDTLDRHPDRSCAHAVATCLPDEAAVRAYEQNGWHIAPPFLPHALLDEVTDAIAAYQAGHRDRALPARGARFSDWQPGDAAVVRNNEFCSLQSDGVRRLVEFPLLGAIAASLARSDTIRLFDDQAIVKPPSAAANPTAVGWHTDHSYWSTCSSNAMLTAWIPLHDTDVENGTLYVVSGSHRWPESEHLRGFNDPDLDGLADRLGRPVPSEAVVPMQLRKGQCSFHHMRAIHASAPNSGSHARVAVAVHMQDGTNRYRAFHTPTGDAVVLPHDRLCRRTIADEPDYADPAVFPVLYSAD